MMQYDVTNKEHSLDLDTAHASEIWAKYINRHTGRRSDAATGTTSRYLKKKVPH
jgi:hypothetical protein